jgi:hypothetical protein
MDPPNLFFIVDKIPSSSKLVVASMEIKLRFKIVEFVSMFA